MAMHDTAMITMCFVGSSDRVTAVTIIQVSEATLTVVADFILLPHCTLVAAYCITQYNFS